MRQNIWEKVWDRDARSCRLSCQMSPAESQWIFQFWNIPQPVPICPNLSTVVTGPRLLGQSWLRLTSATTDWEDSHYFSHLPQQLESNQPASATFTDWIWYHCISTPWEKTDFSYIFLNDYCQKSSQQGLTSLYQFLDWNRKNWPLRFSQVLPYRKLILGN